MSKLELLKPLFNLDELNERLITIEKIIKSKEKSLKDVPNGRLRISIEENNTRYYFRHEGGNTNGKYLRNPNTTLVKHLAQKTYDEKILKYLKREYFYLKKLCQFYKKNDANNTFRKLSEERKKLIEPITLDNEKYAKIWLEDKAKILKNDSFPSSDKDFFTDKGEQVRSKSEVIIANILNRMGVPYCYEFPLKLNSNVTVHPDFCCLNLRTRKEIFWEHFGMMDNAEYAESTVKKIRNYTENGYFAGDSFIYTMETSDQTLNTKEIEKIVKKYLK